MKPIGAPLPRTATTAAAIPLGTCGVGNADLVVVAQRGGREQGKAEELVAHVLRKLLAGRDGAEAVGGYQDLHLGQHLQDDRDADDQLELVVALVGARHADGADHAFQTVGNDGLVRDGQQHILSYLAKTATPSLFWERSCSENINFDGIPIPYYLIDNGPHPATFLIVGHGRKGITEG